MSQAAKKFWITLTSLVSNSGVHLGKRDEGKKWVSISLSGKQSKFKNLHIIKFIIFYFFFSFQHIDKNKTFTKLVKI